MSVHDAMTVKVFPKDGKWYYRCDSNGNGYSGWREFNPDELPVEDLRLLILMFNYMLQEAYVAYYKDKKDISVPPIIKLEGEKQ